MSVVKFNEKGFSLIELMIVVGIIGVLATMAVPRFSAFQARAKQTEAKTTLSHIYTLQEAYFIDQNAYATGGTGSYGATTDGTTVNCTEPTWADEIGFTLSQCDLNRPVYAYSISVPTDPADGAYLAQATTPTAANKLYPNCTTADTWTMNNFRILENTSNAIANCK